MSTTTGPNGQLVVLRAGDYEATIATVGAGLVGLSFQGTDLVLPFPDDQLPPAYAGKTLMPWPNRVMEAAYTFRGQRYELPMNEAATGSALHGLALWNDWRVEQRSDGHVELGHLLHGQPGYPFQLALTASYALSAGTGLHVELTARNCGVQPAPYGSGSHPYLTLGGGDISGCELNVPAGKVLLTDEALRPAGLADTPGTSFDFSQPRLLASQTLDHAFTSLPRGQWEVRLRNPQLKLSAVLQANGTQAPWVQLYSGELRGRRGLAVEPMSCPPDAFNSGQDLVVLDPGQSHMLGYFIHALQG